MIWCAGYVTVQIQPRVRELDHAEYTASTRQQELDSTDQEYIYPETFA